MRFVKLLASALIAISIALGVTGCSTKADPAAGTTAGTQPGTTAGDSTGELPDVLTFEVGYAHHLAWLDGRKILFSGQNPDGLKRLKELDLSTGKTRELTTVTDYEGLISLSPTRDRAVVLRQGAPTTVVAHGGAAGKVVTQAPGFEVVVVNLKGRNEKTIARLETGFLQALWSPTEDLIGVSSDKGLFTIKPDGTDEQMLVESQAPGTEAGVLPRGFTWRPDGKAIAFGVGFYEGAGQISEIKLGEKDPVVLSSSVDAHSPLWSPDGSKLVFVRSPYGEMTSNLILLDPASKVEQEVAGGQSFDFVWLNSQELLFVKGETGESKLYRMPVNDPAQAKLWLNEDGRYFGLAVSPEGDRVAYFHQITDSSPPVLVVRKLQP